MYPRSIARVSEKFLQMRRALDAVAMRAIGFGIFDEIGVAIGEPPILEAHVSLFPTDHAIAAVVQDQHGDVEPEADRKSVVQGKSVSVRVAFGGSGVYK